MIFPTPEIRDAFHRLDTSVQILIHAMFMESAKHGLFLKIEKASGNDIQFRLTRQAEVSLPVD